MADRDAKRQHSERLAVEMDSRVAVAIGLDDGAGSHGHGRVIDVRTAIQVRELSQHGEPSRCRPPRTRRGGHRRRSRRARCACRRRSTRRWRWPRTARPPSRSRRRSSSANPPVLEAAQLREGREEVAGAPGLPPAPIGHCGGHLRVEADPARRGEPALGAAAVSRVRHVDGSRRVPDRDLPGGCELDRQAQAAGEIVSGAERHDPHRRRLACREQAVDDFLHRAVATDGDHPIVTVTDGVGGNGLGVARPACDLDPDVRARSQALAQPIDRLQCAPASGGGVHDHEWGERHRGIVAIRVNRSGALP